MKAQPPRSLLAPLLLLLALPGPAAAEEAVPPAPRWETSVPRGLQRAREEKRLVLVDFWRDGCIYCYRMDRETFPEERVARLLSGLVPVRAKNTGHEAEMERYKVRSFPTLALLDAEGDPIDIQVGYMGPAEFASWLQGAVERHGRYQELKGRLERDPGDLAALLALGKLHSGDGRREEARRLFQAVLKGDPEGKRLESAEALFEIGLIERRSREFKAAVESMGRAREMVLARAAHPPGAPEELVERLLYELAAAQLLAGLRPALIATLEEYDLRVKSPDARRHAWVLLQLGHAQKREGALEAAKRAFRKCDELYTRSPEARECRRELASLE